MTHQITYAAGRPAGADDDYGRWMRALWAAARARLARMRAAHAERETRRILASLDAHQLYDIGLRDGDVRRTRSGGHRGA